MLGTMPPYKILTLGDSVMWGQGLAQPHKFVQLVADHLAAGGREVALAALAHSGAVVCLDPTPPAPFQPTLFGELPRSFPSIASQSAIAGGTPGYAPFLQANGWDSASWRAFKADLQDQIAGYSAPGGGPDLILMDGGINDLGALQIVIPWRLGSADPCNGGTAAQAPAGGVERILDALAAAPGELDAFDLAAIEWMTDAELKALVDRYVYDRMRRQVARVAEAFPQSRVVVTGYFPIFTEGSLDGFEAAGISPAAAVLFGIGGDRRELLAALHWALHPDLDPQAFGNRIVHQSALWYGYSTERLQDVIDEAKVTYGDRFALAVPQFGPDNGALAADSYLWSFTSLVDEVIQKILGLFGGVAPGVEAIGVKIGMAAPAGWENALAFAAGLALGASLATDEVGAPRVRAATDYYVLSATGRSDPETNAFTGFKAGVASAGHPNVDGAKAYFDAIEPALP